MNILFYGDNSPAGRYLIPGFAEFRYTVDYVSNLDPKLNYYTSTTIRLGKS